MGRHVYFLLAIFGTGFVLTTRDRLPNPMAVHFGIQGKADGWATPNSYLALTAMVGLLLPLAIVGLVSFLSSRAPESLNLPERERRLAPANRPEAARRIRAYIWWLPVLMLGLCLAMHGCILVANRQPIPRLPVAGFVASLAAFLGGMVVWMLGWFRVLGGLPGADVPARNRLGDR
jgi:uncharacterized membrane protein